MSDIKVGEGYGTGFPHPAAECRTCQDSGQVWTAEPDGSSAWDMACPDCDTPYPLPVRGLYDLPIFEWAWTEDTGEDPF
jgi:hypothetical protein